MGHHANYRERPEEDQAGEPRGQRSGCAPTSLAARGGKPAPGSTPLPSWCRWNHPSFTQSWNGRGDVDGWTESSSRGHGWAQHCRRGYYARLRRSGARRTAVGGVQQDSAALSREEACEDQESHHRFCQWEGPDAGPCGVRGGDRGVARTWRSPTVRLYVTAAEGLPPPPGNPGEAFNMEKLDEVLVALGRLQSQVDQIQKHPNLAAVPKPKARQSALKTTPARQPEEGEEADAEAILMEVREKLSRKPVRVPDEPGGETMKHQAKDLLEASGAMSGDLNLDDAMKITMLKLLKDMQQGKTSRKKKLPGLPNWEESSSNDEAQGWSSSSRGGRGIEAVEKLRAAMRNHPEAYQSRMEARMLKALEISEMEPGVPAQYIKTIPVGKARTAGYAIHGFAEVLRYMIEGKHKQARLHVLRMLAAFEQFTIDESWVVASRVCGSEEPPWGHWANQDQSALRRQYIYNRLSEATMIGALINELKEEEWLQKKRGGLGKGPGKGDAKDKEKGKDE